MIVYLLVTISTVGLGLLVKRGVESTSPTISRQKLLNLVALPAIFLILFLASALRLNVGNDYAKYVEFMHLIVSNAYVPTEIGFNTVVRIIYGISGFENYLLVFAFLAFFTMLLFLLAIYQQADSFAFSFFLFMTLGYYFQSFSTVRYYLALAIALCSIPLVLKKEWIKFILLILLGATFHKSILVVLPLYVLASLKWKRWQLLLLLAGCSSFFFLQDFYLKVVVFLYPTYEETEYLEGGTSYISIFRCLAVLILSLLLYKKAVEQNRKMNFYFYCNLGALVMYVCCSFLPIISRIGYYLTITHIFFLPELLEKVESHSLKKLLTLGVILSAILYFALLMKRAASPGFRILPYETFVFHDMVPILSETGY